MAVRFRRSPGVTVVAMFGAVVVALAGTAPSLVPVLTATVLAMGGTQHPLSNPPDSDAFTTAYIGAAASNHVDPASAKPGSGIPSGPYKKVAVITPEEFWPVFGSKTFGVSVAQGRANFRNCVHASASCDYNESVSDLLTSDEFVGFGYSESAVIASLVKADLINEYRNRPLDSPIISFYLLSNPMRPNGGILMKFNKLTIPILDIPMYGATPTDTCGTGDVCYPTVDFAYQYDIFGGGTPNNMFNVLALVNSVAGYLLVHGDMPNQSLDDPDVVDQGAMGDTQYYMKEADLMPLLMPLESIGVPRALLLVANAPLQVLIEGAYRRDIHPGEPTPQYLISINNPVGVGINFLRAIPVGIDDGLEEAGLPRVFGTQPAGPYGVGGEDEELTGRPAGFIPLGKPDPTPHTSQVATDTVDRKLAAADPVGVAGVAGGNEKSDVPQDPSITSDVDAALGDTVTNEMKRPRKSVLQDRIVKRRNDVQERPTPTRPESIRPGAGNRPLRELLSGVRDRHQMANSRGANRSVTSHGTEKSE
jgi:PE-PPE domain